MSRKHLNTSPPPEPHSSLPHTLRLTNLTNQPSHSQVHTLRSRIEELESKVHNLQNKLKSKRKRIRRKSSEVEKKHECEYCKRQYGSLVSLNLHTRIKHKREKAEKKSRDRQQAVLKEGKQDSPRLKGK